VPLIAVSPNAKPRYVSDVTDDFGSILRFVEQNLTLPSLGYSDARADDINECFDYNQTPLTFHTILEPLDASYFPEDNRPPIDSDD